jgi:hypothetical protein
MDPSYPLQRAVYERLMTSSLGTDHVYDSVPQGTPLPWVIIGNDQILSAYEEGGAFHECFVTVDVFGTKPDFKILAAKVRIALDFPLVIEGFLTAEAFYEGVRYLTDGDGKTGHAVLTFRYLVEEDPAP